MQRITESFKSTWSEDVKSSHVQHDISHFRLIMIMLNANKKSSLIKSELVWRQYIFCTDLLIWVTGDPLVHKGLIKWSFSCLETIIDPLVICAWENVWRWKCFNASIKLFCNEFMIMKHVSLFHFIKCIHIHW